jgi:hypothetical protein
MENRVRYREGSRPGDKSGVLSVEYVCNGVKVTKYRRWSKDRPESVVVDDLTKLQNRYGG